MTFGRVCLYPSCELSANTMTWPNVVLILDQRHRRWADIETALGDVIVFAGLDASKLSGQAQIWFSSYLQNRHQSVKIKDTLSDKFTLSYGVPQSFELGSLLFTLYTTPLSSIISSSHIHHYLYVDDTQMYIALSVPNAKESLEKLQHCVIAVSA